MYKPESCKHQPEFEDSLLTENTLENVAQSSVLRTSPTTRSSPLVPLSVFLGSLLLFVCFLPRCDFVTRGEAREALVVQAMEHQQNLILPLRNGADIPSKPPLFHWLAYASSHLFAHPEWAIRLPSAVSAATILMLLVSFSLPILGMRSALLAALFLLCSLEFFRSAMVARVDMTFTLWVAAALFALARTVSDFILDRKRNYLALSTATLAIVFGVWTKGPAALVFPWCIAGITLLCFVPWKQIPWLLAVSSVAVSAAISAIWYFAAYRYGGQTFLDILLMRENMARVIGMSEYHTGHEGHFYMPCILLLAALLPLSPALLLIPEAIMKQKDQRLKPVLIFAVVWGLFFPLFFSFTASKRSVYLLPALPAWVFLMSFACTHYSGNARAYGKWGAVALFLFRATAVVVLLAALVIASVVAFPSLVDLIHLSELKRYIFQACLDRFKGSPFSMFLVFLAAAAACLVFFRREKYSIVRTLLLLATSVLSIQLAAFSSILPGLSQAVTPLPFVTQIAKYVDGRQGHLFQYDDDFYAANYYLGRDLPRLNMGASPPKDRPVFLLIRMRQMAHVRQTFPGLTVHFTSEAPIVYGQDRFALVEVPISG